MSNSVRKRVLGKGSAHGVHAIAGAVIGLAFYGVVGLLLLKVLLGPTLQQYFGTTGEWASRFLGDPINAITLAAFGAAAAILFARNGVVNWEFEQFSTGLIDEHDDRLTTPQVARDLRKKIASIGEESKNSTAMRMLASALNRARASWSASEVADAINMESDIMAAKLDSDYSMIRYLAWAIPSIGFIGTVLGIGRAMGTIGGPSSSDDGASNGIAEAASHLNTAFDTTFVSLTLSLILMYFVYSIQAKEERVISTAVEWCNRHFVNRMHVEANK